MIVYLLYPLATLHKSIIVALLHLSTEYGNKEHAAHEFLSEFIK